MHIKFETTKDIIDESKGFDSEYIDTLRHNIITTISRTRASFNSNPKLKKLDLQIVINEDLVNQVIIDAVEDLKRNIEFHSIKKANKIKQSSYIAYWWLQRKPAYVMNDIYSLDIDDDIKVKLIFFNEVAILAYLLESVFDFKKNSDVIQYNGARTDKWKKEWSEARKYWLYFLVYRAKTPKSIEAFMYSSVLQPLWEQKEKFWDSEVL